ncbi:hypothetical protein ALC53_04721 [Atta colombica]|uniref:Uncharacterized protein n=1 Tax=Atta colombica TaxID=520822 RepID=A0A195BJX8_9HYME|nr:hypothetical protein ALC53_04721 [Atta colombica]
MRHGSKFNGNSKRIYSISATFQLASFNLLMMGLSTFYVECRNVFKLNIFANLRTIKLEAPKVQGIIKSINYITPSTAYSPTWYTVGYYIRKAPRSFAITAGTGRTTNISIWKKYCISDMEYFYSHLLATERYCLP